MILKQYEIHLADNRIFAFWGNELNIQGGANLAAANLAAKREKS